MTFSHADITRILAEHGLAPRRAFGQNFVADPNTVRRIARLAEVGPGDLVVEVGAGLGSLTLALAETGADVIAVEVDRGLVPVLRSVTSDHGNVTVVEGDAMTLDWNALVTRDATLVANLPYNIATPMIADLLDTVPHLRRFVVMVQREVALRLAASPGSGDYGAVSVKVSYWATARLLGDVPATVFVPRPKVVSSIIEITRRAEPAVAPDVPAAELFALVRQAFGQRRKMLRRSLADRTSPEIFSSAGVSPEARPEQLDVEQWGRLTRAVLDARENDRERMK